MHDTLDIGDAELIQRIGTGDTEAFAIFHMFIISQWLRLQLKHLLDL